MRIFIDSFLKDSRGGVAPLLALAAIPLVTVTGAAVDYSRAASLRAALQAAVDSAVLGMASSEQPIQDPSAQADSTVRALITKPELQVLSVSATTQKTIGTATFSIAAKGSVKNAFMGGLGFSEIAVTANATAVRQKDELGCVLALSPDKTSALAIKGSSRVALKGCSLYSNSTASPALSISGSATLSARAAGAVGTLAISSTSVTLDEGAVHGISPVEDPYAEVAMPSFRGCTESNLSIKMERSISPGVYCDGITVNAGGILTLSSGVYFFDRGAFMVNGGGTVKGQGVTLIFTSSTGSKWATLSLNGDAVVNLTAPNFGPTAGIVIFGDRNLPAGSDFKFSGGAEQYLGGAVYLPTANVSFSGGMGTSTNCTQLIGHSVEFSGNSNLSLNCSNHKIKPFGTKTIKLTS